VALAEALGFPLATSDLRLSRGAPDTVEILTLEDM
jgi:predicted nucleic acid-binding protein